MDGIVFNDLTKQIQYFRSKAPLSKIALRLKPLGETNPIVEHSCPPRASLSLPLFPFPSPFSSYLALCPLLLEAPSHGRGRALPRALRKAA